MSRLAAELTRVFGDPPVAPRAVVRVEVGSGQGLDAARLDLRKSLLQLGDCDHSARHELGAHQVERFANQFVQVDGGLAGHGLAHGRRQGGGDHDVVVAQSHVIAPKVCIAEAMVAG